MIPSEGLNAEGCWGVGETQKKRGTKMQGYAFGEVLVLYCLGVENIC